MRRLFVAALVMPLMLGGCMGAAVDLAALPFKVTGQVVDKTTTSQAEEDERLGRSIREAREARDWDR